ncbi:MAG: methyltransferase domain-containing protein [Anaerolineaceae bacterium]|nr:methyltransferase domain-containing protein [Anaerolineaceae bacterium]
MANDPYRQFAPIYDPIVGRFNTGLRELSLKVYPPRPGMKVLDVACGSGLHLQTYREAGCAITGIDKSPSMLGVARKNLGEDADLHLADARQMPFGDDSFDLVTISLAIHEMRQAMREGVTREMKRVLKPDGRILVIDFHTGPYQFPQGWLQKGVLVMAEIVAGREHFTNYRDFMARRGVPPFAEANGLVVDKQRIVGGGTMGLFLLRVE